MLNKVYMVTVDAAKFVQTSPPVYLEGDIFYVRATDEETAKESVREAVKKYYFLAKLANAAKQSPGRLGKNIIVEQWVTEATATAPLKTEDVTAMAYMWSAVGKEYWSDWEISLGDFDA